jgi:hypothetical protein
MRTLAFSEEPVIDTMPRSSKVSRCRGYRVLIIVLRD